MSDDLTQQLQKNPGSKSLWGIWYKALYPQVMYRTFRLLRGSEVHAEDLVQDAFIKCIDNDLLQGFSSDEHAVNYISQMVKSSHFSEFRKEQRREELREIYATDIRQLHHSTVEEGVIDTLPADLIKAIKGLPAEDRVLMTGLLEGKSLSDLASEMKLTYSAIGVRSHRLKKKIRRFLQKKRI